MKLRYQTTQAHLVRLFSILCVQIRFRVSGKFGDGVILMFLSPDERSTCLVKLRKLHEDLASSQSREYFQTMISQIITLIESDQELRTINRSDNYFSAAFESIKQKLLQEMNADVLRELHFEMAYFLRNLSYGGFHNFNEHSIVRFYLDQQFTEIEYKKIDDMRFNVPLKFVLAPYENELKKVRDIHVKVEGWEGELNEWAEKVSNSEKRYEGVLGKNNYLGLASAFRALLEDKNKELERAYRALLVVGFLATVIPIIYLLIGNSTKIADILSGNHEVGVIATLLFSVALEVLILYYFRIIYSQWSLVKHQLLQLNLRHQMCAFASDYARNAHDMDKSTLAKFENLVFSELSSDTAVPPSIYDAADAISKVIGSIRKG